MGAVVDALLEVVDGDFIEAHGPDGAEVLERRFIAVHRALALALPLVGGEPQAEKLGEGDLLRGALPGGQLGEVLHGGLFRGKAAFGDADGFQLAVVQGLIADDLHSHPAAVLALVDAAGAVPPAGPLPLGGRLLFPALGAEKGALGDFPLTFHANQEKHLPSPCKTVRKVVE